MFDTRYLYIISYYCVYFVSFHLTSIIIIVKFRPKGPQVVENNIRRLFTSFMNFL